MNFRHWVICLLSLTFMTVPVLADQVHLTNGDILSGTIVKLVDGQMTFNSDLIGETVIPLDHIQTLSSDAPVELHLSDGTILNRQLRPAEGRRFAFQSGDTVIGQELFIANIVSINPPAKPTPKWTGQLSAGLTSTHGNTKAENQNLSFRAKKRTDIDRITVNADYVRGRQEDPSTGMTNTTEDWWRTKAKYDYFINSKWYTYVDGRYERDAVAQLERRMVIGGGGGLQIIDTDRTQLSSELGLASLYEKFNNQTSSNSEISLQAGYELEHTISEGLQLFHDLTYYPSIEKFADYYLTTTAELRANFTARMFANVRAIFNYDATPAIGQGGTDIKYILGVGLDF